ncbi:tyrosine-type recombinase/integrase [Deinococcus cellulosilyticus]|uniref:Integrase n=1 Tax=Deinococcus cellulosilyticus (strain DSM 18568 / NBRC 106333 / KACC 11606 / 5516J-15) TaxID=1223518 RepID=A0A511N725_DEIC1|nr:site-specific integrase [Deinococcus cellulosilyticus]GEM48653.1 integrase [Deinococcus cellulosilyticus NBRC 106333 = KACC 11606]
MSRGGYRAESFPWGAVKPERRKEKVREMVLAADHDGLWALLKHHLTTWGKAGAHTSTNTLRTYRTGLNMFLDYLTRTGLEGEDLLEVLLSPSEDLGAEYLRHLERSGSSPSTVNARRASATAFYRALKWAGASEANPFLDVPAVKDNTPKHEKRQPYTDEDVKKMLDAATEEEKIIIGLGAYAGLRIHEIAKLTWGDVDLDRKQIRVDGKGGKVARVPIPAGLRALLEAAPKGQGEGVRVVAWERPNTIRDHIKAVCKRAKVKYRGVHSLRHYAGTYLYRQTKNLDMVARVLRHSNIETSRVYAKYGEDMYQDVLDAWK